MGLATVIRLEFAYPGVGILAGDSLQYLSIATAHGVIMVFFMIMPALFGAFGNFLLPTQLGVHDVAFPRLNSAAFWFLPGGLIMLAQLVCVDRRYQRMNCFNIRELQSMLKKRFFTDLVNSNDHRELLHSTMVGLRYKNNSNTLLETDIFSFYNNGTTFTSKSKGVELSSSLVNSSDFNYPVLQYTINYIYYVFNSALGLLSNLVINPINSKLTNNLQTSFNDNYYNTVLSYDDFIFNITRVVQNLSLMSITSITQTINVLPEVLSFNFNWDLSSAYKLKSKENATESSDNNLSFNSNSVNNVVDFNLHATSELSNSVRFTRYSNPLINYSYKSGHYLGI